MELWGRLRPPHPPGEPYKLLVEEKNKQVGFSLTSLVCKLDLHMFDIRNLKFQDDRLLRLHTSHRTPSGNLLCGQY